MSDPTSRSPIGLIARREIRQRVRATSYLAFTGLLAVLILAMGVLGRVAGSDGEPERDVVGVTGEVPGGFAEAASALAGSLDREVTVEAVDPADAPRLLDGGDVDAVLVVDERRVRHGGEVDDELQAIVQQAWAGTEVRRALIDAGVAEGEADGLVSPVALTADTLDGEGDDEPAGVAVLAGTVTAVLLFVSLQMFGGYALVGVVEEKSTAVVELLLVRVRADELLAGKLVGIGVAALLQFGVAVVAGLGALAISGVDVPGEIWSALPLALLWFAGGYALYSTLFALAGSLVSRQEDAQAAAAPILTVLVAAYVLVFIVGYSPDALVSRVLSVLPPVAPFLMPMRMAAGAASVPEVVVALVLLAGSTVVAWKVSGRIYEQVLLRRGSRVPWRVALRLLRSG